jgi:hypothetical protein
MVDQVTIDPYTKWIEQENKGRRLFYEALVATGIDIVHLAKNEDVYGVDVLMLVEDLEASKWKCIGVLEIENSTSVSWDYARYSKFDGFQLPPLTWRKYGQITVPYRRLPRFLNPDSEVIVNGTIIQLGINEQNRFYQKWDESLNAFYMIDFTVARQAITAKAFLYKPDNRVNDTFKSHNWEVLFKTRNCDEYWCQDLGNRFINLWEFRDRVTWAAFGNQSYPVVAAVCKVWKQCGIKHAKDRPGKQYNALSQKMF